MTENWTTNSSGVHSLEGLSSLGQSIAVFLFVAFILFLVVLVVKDSLRNKEELKCKLYLGGAIVAYIIVHIIIVVN